MGWRLAQVTRDQPTIDVLLATPLDVLRRSTSRGDECLYLFVAALQALQQRADDWSSKLRIALDATDATKLQLSDEDFVLNVLVPEMELLLRLVIGDVAAFNAALHFALERHKKDWSRASRKRDPDGYVALGPLAIASIARRGGMPIQVSSDYVPPPLLLLGENLR